MSVEVEMNQHVGRTCLVNSELSSGVSLCRVDVLLPWWHLLEPLVFITWWILDSSVSPSLEPVFLGYAWCIRADSVHQPCLSMVPTATVGKKYLGKTCKFSQMSKMWRVIYAKKLRRRQQTEPLFSLTHQMLRHGTVLLRLPLRGPSSFS